MAKKVQEVSADKRDFVNIIFSMQGRYQLWEIWSDLITMYACAISNAVDRVHAKQREALYMKTILKYTKAEQEKLPELVALMTMAIESDKNRDFLGELYMVLELGNHWKGQFFTPYSVCEGMAKTTCAGIAEQVHNKGFVSVADPSCGAGALLIAAANEAERQLEGRCWQDHVLFCAQDIDEVTGLMCYIQLSLLGCAGYVKIGDSLRDPMTPREAEYNSHTPESNYWYTPMYFSDVWQGRRKCRVLDRIIDRIRV